MKIAIIIIHGIGVTKKGYSEDFQKKLADVFSGEAQKLLRDKTDRKNELAFREINWDSILAENQGRFHDILMKDKSLQYTRGLFTALKNIMMNQLLNFRINFASKFIADILTYRNSTVYTKIHSYIKSEVQDILANHPSETPVTMIAHSLGTVVASDYVWDRQKEFHQLASAHKLWNLFTMGSPLALFALKEGADVFNLPIHMDHSAGNWINIFDDDDLIAFKLKILNPAYDKAVLHDLLIDTGNLVDSHTAYWGCDKVLKTIGRKLAIDWVRVNNLMSQGDLDNAVRQYEAQISV